MGEHEVQRQHHERNSEGNLIMAQSPSNQPLPPSGIPNQPLPLPPSGTPNAGCGAGAAPVPCILCPNSVKFEEHPVTKYGFDDFTDAAKPWKSVEVGKKDRVIAKITPANANEIANTKFKSSDETIAKVSPNTATSSSQTLEIEGVKKGETTVKATCDTSDKATLNVVVYPKKTKTVAIRLVHEKNYTSTDVADADIRAYLKKVYDQAVFEFVVTRLPAKKVAFDLNGDGKIDVDSWVSGEMQKIIDECKDTGYDHNLFLVDKPSDGSLGFMDFNQRYGFIHADKSNPSNTIAHELGHGSFGLHHFDTDTKNLMHSNLPDVWRLRKDQWEKIQQ